MFQITLNFLENDRPRNRNVDQANNRETPQLIFTANRVVLRKYRWE